MTEKGSVNGIPRTGRSAIHRLAKRFVALVTAFALSPVGFLVCFGLLIRIALGIYSSEADLSVFASISLAMVKGGGPYSYLNNYPPGWDFLLNLVGHIALLVDPSGVFANPIPTIPLLGTQVTLERAYTVSPAYALVEKSVIWIFDLGVGSQLFLLTRALRAPLLSPTVVFGLWFLNPLVISESAIHGSFDAMPVFFALASIYLLLNRFALFSGLSLGLGITLKIFPVFFVPIMIVMLLRNVGESRKGRTSALGRFGLGIGGVGALIFWPPGVLSDFLRYSTTGPVVGINYAGFWVWSLTSLPGSRGLQLWLFTHAEMVVIYSTVLAAGIAVAVGVALFLKSRPSRTISFEVVMASAILCVIAAYFVTPTVQPQYILWILPFVILITTVDRRFRWPVGILSALPTIFEQVALAGPLYFWQGLSIYAHALSAAQIASSVAYFSSEKNTLWPILFVPTFLTLIFVTVMCARTFQKSAV